MDGSGLEILGVEIVADGGVQLRTKPFTSVREIKAAFAKRYKVTVADLEGSSRKRMYAIPRQAAMALCYRRLKRYGYSLPVIGKHFGGRDHTTVLFACRKYGHTPNPSESRNAPLQITHRRRAPA